MILFPPLSNGKLSSVSKLDGSLYVHIPIKSNNNNQNNQNSQNQNQNQNHNHNNNNNLNDKSYSKIQNQLSIEEDELWIKSQEEKSNQISMHLMSFDPKKKYIGIYDPNEYIASNKNSNNSKANLKSSSGINNNIANKKNEVFQRKRPFNNNQSGNTSVNMTDNNDFYIQPSPVPNNNINNNNNSNNLNNRILPNNSNNQRSFLGDDDDDDDDEGNEDDFDDYNLNNGDYDDYDDFDNHLISPNHSISQYDEDIKRNLFSSGNMDIINESSSIDEKSIHFTKEEREEQFRIQQHILFEKDQLNQQKLYNDGDYEENDSGIEYQDMDESSSFINNSCNISNNSSIENNQLQFNFNNNNNNIDNNHDNHNANNNLNNYVNNSNNTDISDDSFDKYYKQIEERKKQLQPTKQERISLNNSSLGLSSHGKINFDVSEELSDINSNNQSTSHHSSINNSVEMDDNDMDTSSMDQSLNNSINKNNNNNNNNNSFRLSQTPLSSRKFNQIFKTPNSMIYNDNSLNNNNSYDFEYLENHHQPTKRQPNSIQRNRLNFGSNDDSFDQQYNKLHQQQQQQLDDSNVECNDQSMDISVSMD
ncbi:hypothetical protein DICPUDRAFT_75505 [Dictyostelium purpureum]|uniref:Uncharacterized protein n=1 Tax=Dictyostelium purpureum TaxID=5786 RepID=F0ZAU9_DICPU|nr:uncharacterized protein DICPUDRAFT_75505 [Dictyostelium purpureum]EGC38982.1 hypothetical protein DICPUDRAFT_75505 [Dictyostelium purpureum]|eukprot:XP_003284547.1 hypothetical protein DICPUDRAFT_75505 [Dictyostelium purpureum]